ncbi:MAG TPA: hypothetical protein VK427_27505, partial [Kofleriaceae bacterium]|nr:hypothetical protein [Kofleriaceae bacterium]
MYRLAALAVVLGCSQPQTRIVLGEPPSEDAADALHVSAMPNVRFAIAGTSDDELAAAALAYVRDNLAPLAADDFAFAGAAVDPELISIQLAQRYHGLPVIGGHLGLVISRGNLVLVQGNPTPI